MTCNPPGSGTPDSEAWSGRVQGLCSAPSRLLAGTQEGHVHGQDEDRDGHRDGETGMRTETERVSRVCGSCWCGACCVID
eukprot:321731-Prorocentrum_lima.AAC.1